MNGTWWVGPSELDDNQRNIISLPLDNSVLVTGPPGSGKTNLLLLRANNHYLAGQRNIVLVTFTRSLREFIARGAAQYDFPTSKIMTSRQWQFDCLRQYGRSVTSSGDFETDREAFLSAITNLTDQRKLANCFDAILLDEAQDYTPDEIRLFARLTERPFCVADERQKIYDGEESIDVIKSYVGETLALNLHYRNGLYIGRVADEIAKRWYSYQPLRGWLSARELSNQPSLGLSPADISDVWALVLSAVAGVRSNQAQAQSEPLVVEALQEV
jgi:AAA domain